MADRQARPGRPYSLHRVVKPTGVFPQQAWRIDNDPRPYDNELSIACEALYLESSNFAWLRETSADNPEAMAAALQSLIEQRGKAHNPETDTGGVMIGTIKSIGDACVRHRDLQPGQEVGCLTSLTQIPLHIEGIRSIDLSAGLIYLDGTAIAPDLGVVVPTPAGLPRALQLSMFEVAGIAPHVASCVRPGMRVAILGAGTPTGLFATYAALEGVGDEGLVVAVEADAAGRQRLAHTTADPHVIHKIPLAASVVLADMAADMTGGQLFDVTVHCADAAGTELGAVAMTRPKGTVIYFSMTTRFGAAAIAGEAFAREQELLIGKGFLAGHVAHSAGLIHRHPRLRAALETPLTGL